MLEYRVFVQSMYDRCCGFYETYGISLFDNGEMIRIIRDVSVEREKVEHLIDQLNSEQLEPQHLNQVIEDFLTDFDA